MQANINAENGITLNIGTLASLAPIGPIRLAPTTVSQSPPKASKSSTTPNKLPKIISNVPLQSVPKMKTIVSSNKSHSNTISSNYKQVNVPDKNGDAKLVNIFTTGGNQIRVNTSSGGKMHNSFRTNLKGKI